MADEVKRQANDPMGVGLALDKFTDQVRNAFEQAMASNIPQVEYAKVLVSGMGGSSNAGKVIESLVQEKNKKLFFVFNDYGLPGWVDKDTLVVVNSYSGNTEETLSGVEEAQKRGAKLLGVTTGGKMGEMIKSASFPGVIVDPQETNPPGFPKSGLGVSFGGLFGALLKAGTLPFTKEALFLSLAELDELKKVWEPLAIANDLNGFLPVLFAGRPLLGPLNAGRNALCEIGRVFSLFFDFPEVDHVLIEATQKPAFIKEKAKYLFFESKFLNPRVLKRYEVTKEIFREQDLSYLSVKLEGSTILTQALELPLLCSWLGYHLSLLRNDDPGPEPWIIKLKEKLSQPTH